ncbi:MAG: hypothetical protein A3F16_01300 [Deltaproteobacteria bacterium RIFCSPHIGHO2_12_FULL_43_9]|nr:MAG: hypothetical protein A3F16_01300 [Deltaproteobacteria bacterium RIFCSPHIGHO2_12_FULL_43_9]
MKEKIVLATAFIALVIFHSYPVFASEPGFVRSPAQIVGSVIPRAKPGTVIPRAKPVGDPYDSSDSDGYLPVIKNRLERLKVKDALVETLFRSLAAETGRNIIIDGKVTGTVSVDLKDVSVDEAIQAIARASGNGAEFRPGYIIIRPIKESEQSKVIQLQYINGLDVQKGLENFLTENGKLSYDPDSNAIMIRDQPSAVSDLATFIQEIDRTPKQVLVEAAILEVRLEDDISSGVDFLWQGGSRYRVGTQNFATSPTAGSPDGFFFRIVQNGITGIISLLEERTKTKVIARPRILAMNDREAFVRVGGRQGYPQTIQLNTGATQEQIAFLDTGILLTITPHITEDRQVILKVHPEISDASLDASNIPSERATEASAIVKVKDGQTLILGGLKREELVDDDDQVPVLGDLPLVGFLFKKKVRQIDRREVMILVTPHIVDGGFENKTVVADIERAKENYREMMDTDFVGLKDRSQKRNSTIDGTGR